MNTEIKEYSKVESALAHRSPQAADVADARALLKSFVDRFGGHNEFAKIAGLISDFLGAK